MAVISNHCQKGNRYMIKEFNAMDMALKMAENGRKVYPTVAGKKMPFKGTHAQNDATNDPEQVFEMFQAHPGADVSLKLDGLIVLDIDQHDGGVNGALSIREADIKLPTNTRLETTPHDGKHFFFKFNGEPFNHLDLLPGVEVRGDQIKIAPSVGYELNIDKPIQPAPDWLLKLIEQNRKPKYQPNSAYVPGQITFIGKKLNELMGGAPQGTRNKWLTNQIGFYIGQGVQPSKVYKLLWWITQTELTGTKPIKRNEFDATFNSVLRREKTKKSVIKAGGGLIG